MEKLKIIVKGHSKIEGHIIYELSIQFDDDISFTVQKRYSELKTMHDSLRRETNSNSFPKFPPKKFFGVQNEDFINKRQQELNLFFEGICSSKEFMELPTFKKFIDSFAKNIKDKKMNAEKKEKKNTNILKKKMSDKTKLNPIVEKLKPEKQENKRLTQDEIKKMESEFDSIINDLNKKYIPIDFQVELNPKQKNEDEYIKIINEDNNLGNKEIKEEGIEPGTDDNFNLVSETNESVDGIEKEISQKMQDIINKRKEIEKIYDINDIVKIL